jgi:mRNA interferase HigB
MRRLRDFWLQHPTAEPSLRAWHERVRRVAWKNFAEVRSEFPSADLVKRLTVFNISGNHYRLIVRIEYELQCVYIRAVLTHDEYDEEKWKNDAWFSE